MNELLVCADKSLLLNDQSNVGVSVAWPYIHSNGILLSLHCKVISGQWRRQDLVRGGTRQPHGVECQSLCGLK